MKSGHFVSDGTGEGFEDGSLNSNHQNRSFHPYPALLPQGNAAIRRRESGKSSRLPIIALTANAMQGDRELYESIGMDDYILKPFQPEQLIETLAGIISKRYAAPLRSVAEDVEPDVVTI